jgi:autotransporter-associated beta strand protein
VQAAGVNGLSPNSAVTVLSGASLDIAGYSQTIASLAGAGTVLNSFASPATLTTGGDNASTTFSGLITDAGGGALTLDKVGTGTFTISGANSYTGGTLLESGAIVVANPQALGTGALTISPNATLQFGGSLSLANAIVLSGAGAQNIDTGAQTVALTGGISGAGTLNKLGSGGLILSSANTYTGGTTLNAGALGIGASGALGTGALTMSAGASVQFMAANITLANNISFASAGVYLFDTAGQTATLSGVVSGPGALQKIDTGTLVLSGANTFSGGANVLAGTLAVAGASALGTGAVNLSDGATLQVLVNNLNVANAVSLVGGNASLDTVANTVTLSGVVSGAGALNKLGAGALILATANSFTGGANIYAGTLGVANASALGSGTLGINGGATFQILANGVSVANSVSLLGGSGVVDTGANMATFSGPVSGAGGLYKIGSGELTLSGNNSFAGGATVAAGTLGVGASGALGSGGAMLGAGTTLQFTSANLMIANAIGLAGTGAVTFDTGAQTETIAGVISGSAALQKVGAGVLVLNGANTFAGGVNLAAGTLGVGNASAFGSGAVNLSSGATLQILSPSLSIGNAIALLGGVSNIDTGANTATLSGPVSSAGALNKLGSGELILTGANTFTGGTTVSAGTLGLGAGGALGSGVLTLNPGAGLQFTAAGVNLPNAIALQGAGLYQIDTGSQTAALSGVVSGPGALQKVGGGTLFLTGANTFSGGVNVLAGTLGVGAASALGSGALTLSDGTTLQIVANNLNLGNSVALLGPDPTIDTGANNVTMSGVLSGPGALTKLGTGALFLTATNTYTGATAINAGALEVDGSIASSPLTTVGSGAMLLGVGRVGGVIVNPGGLLASGNGAAPYGTLTATGAVTFSDGSTYAINISPGAVSLLTILKSASVAGNVAVNAVAGAYNPSVKYDILTAAGGVSGTFGSVTVSGAPGYSGLLTYDPNNVYLQIEAGNPSASIHDVAVSRESQMVTARVLGSLLIGANQQINCSACVSGFAAVGSLAIGTSGRFPITERLTLLAGASFDNFSAGGAQVTGAPILAASLRYDLVDWGRSRPFFEVGAEVAPYEVSSYTRTYAFGGGTGTGTGTTTSSGVSAFARAGWVWRASRADEIAVYGDIDRNWQKTSGYTEATSILNPQPASFAGGVDTFNIVRVGGQYTRLFNPRLEANVNLAVAYGFGAGVGVDASVPGFGAVPNTGIAASTWIEFGGRIGYRVADRVTIDAFLLGTAGAKPAGETLHGGLGLRYSF